MERVRRRGEPSTAGTRLLLLLCAASVGCSSPDAATLRVDLRTDYIPQTEAARSRVALEGFELSAVHTLGLGDYQQGVRAATFTQLRPQRGVRGTLFLEGPSGALLSSRRFVLDLAGDVGVTVFLGRSCGERTCEPDRTCVDGRCLAPECLDGTQPNCERDRCEAECVASVGCARADCARGLCQQAPGPCLDPLSCDLARGCIAETPDAALPDAAPLNAATVADAGRDVGIDAPLPDAAADGGSVAWPPVARVSERDGEPADTMAVHARVARNGAAVCFHTAATTLDPANDQMQVLLARPGESPMRLTSAMGVSAFNCEIDDAGEVVVFRSIASNLVPGDMNGHQDVFAWEGGVITRVSTAQDGTEGNLSSSWARVSGNGRFVVFESAASNLVPGDTNDRNDVFLKDRETGAVERISVGSGGEQGSEHAGEPDVTTDGRFVVFVSDASEISAGDTNGQADVFLRDRMLGTTRRLTEGAANAVWARIAPDGSFVVFVTDAALVVEDTDSERDAYALEIGSGQVRRVSQGEAIRPDVGEGGRFAFQSLSDDSRVFAYDWARDQLVALASAAADPGVSPDGRWVVFQSDAALVGPADAEANVFIVDLQPFFD